MKQQIRKLSRSKLTFIILTLIGLVNSIVSDDILEVDKQSDNLSSSTLKMEARDDDDSNHNMEIINSNNNQNSSEAIYIPQSRSNVVTKNNNWKRFKGVRDSYLDALEYSHLRKNNNPNLLKGVVVNNSPLIQKNHENVKLDGESDRRNSRISYESNQGPVYDINNQIPYGTVQNNYLPPASPPPPPPSLSYGPPYTNYLPPKQNHQGEPRGYQWNGYASQDVSHLPMFPSIDWWPFAIKLNAFTIAKILLKLVIFKMIVKFIAVICLLLFIPKLEMKKNDKDDDDETESRHLKSAQADIQLNNLTSIVHESIEHYEKNNSKIDNNNDDECRSVSCHVERFLGLGETWNDYINLFKNYLTEERNNKIDDKQSTKS